MVKVLQDVSFTFAREVFLAGSGSGGKFWGNPHDQSFELSLTR